MGSVHGPLHSQKGGSAVSRFASVFSQLLQLFTPGGVSASGEGAQSRTPSPGLHLLGPVRRHAVLPVGPRPFPPGALSAFGTGRSAAAWPPARGSSALGGSRRPVDPPGSPQVPVQDHAPQPGRLGDRSLRQPVRLGDVPLLRRDHRGAAAWGPGGPDAPLRPRHHPGHRPGLRGRHRVRHPPPSRGSAS